MTSTRQRLPGLDALRGVAALMVLLFHTRGLILPMSALSHGYLAVDLFFVISGFVLGRAHDAGLAAGGGRAFVRQRIVRLYPMVLLGLALGAGLLLARGVDLATVGLLAVLGALFIPVTGSADIFPLNGPQWSLMWELAVNLLYALIAPQLTLRRLVLLTAGGGVLYAALAVRFGTGSLGSHGADWFGGAPRVVFGFFVGVLLARLAVARRLKIPALPIWANLAIVIAVLTAPGLGAGNAAFDLGAVLIVMPLLVGSAAGAEVGALSPLLDGLAGISYALYALHIPILVSAADLATRGALPWAPKSLVGAVAVMLALSLATLAHRYFEPWAARRLLGFGQRPQSRSTSLPSSITR